VICSPSWKQIPKLADDWYSVNLKKKIRNLDTSDENIKKPRKFDII
jgi:hypothetical protein